MDLVVIAISFAIAVTPVVVAQVLTQRGQRQADSDRADREERDRRRKRGEDAATEIMDELFRVELEFFSVWRDRKIHFPYVEPHARQADLEATSVLIRRKALLIPATDVSVFSRRLATAVFYYSNAAEWRRCPHRQVWQELVADADDVLGAFIRGNKRPQPQFLAAIERDEDSEAEWIDEQLREQEEPEADATTPPDGGSSSSRE